MNGLIIILIVIVVGLCFSHFQKTVKIAYYETKLKNRDVDISKVKNMPFYKLWLD